MTGRNAVVVSAVLAFLSSLAVASFVLGDMPFAGDGIDYWKEAGLWLGGMKDRPWYYPPGMVVWLGLWRLLPLPGILKARLSIAVLSAITTGVTCKMATELIHCRRAAIWAGLISALYPPALLLSGQPVSQHLAQAALGVCCLLWLFVLKDIGRLPGLAEPRSNRIPAPRRPGTPRPRHRYLCHAAGAGIALGIGMLTRPAMGSVGLAMALTALMEAWRQRGNLKRTSHFIGLTAIFRHSLPLGLAALSCLLVLLPFLLHNHRVGAGPVISINNERNFWLGNNPYTPLYKTTHLAQRSLDELPEDTRRYLVRHYIRSDVSEMRLRTRLSKTLRAVRMLSAIEHIRDRPDLFLLRTLNRSRAFWGFDYLGARQIQRWKGWSLAKLTPLYLTEAGSYCAVMALVLTGLLSREKTPGAKPVEGWPAGSRQGWRQKTPLKWVLVVFVLAYELPYCLAFSAGTYHFPVMVLLFPLAAAGIMSLRAKGCRRTVFSWPVVVALTVFAAIQAEYAYFTLLYH